MVKTADFDVHENFYLGKLFESDDPKTIRKKLLTRTLSFERNRMVRKLSQMSIILKDDNNFTAHCKMIFAVIDLQRPIKCNLIRSEQITGQISGQIFGCGHLVPTNLVGWGPFWVASDSDKDEFRFWVAFWSGFTSS